MRRLARGMTTAQRPAHRGPVAVLAVAAMVAAVLVLTGSDAATRDRILNADSPAAIPGEFVVMFDRTRPVPDTAALAADLAARHGGTVIRVYPGMGGFALAADDQQAERMAADPAVHMLERNQRGSRQDTQNLTVTPLQPWHLWNLDRIDQRTPSFDYRYNYGTTAVPIYVVDDGILINHTEFGGPLGRARNGFTAFPMDGNRDCDGHGTAVAAVAAGNTFGVAKQAAIVSVKVFDCARGEVDTTTTVAGLDYILRSGQKPAVVNLSIGFPPDPILDATVRLLLQAGFTTVIAAGNYNSDACGLSPGVLGGEAGGAITVGATDMLDYRWESGQFDGSNWGDCVSIFAPGVDIMSASHTKPSLPLSSPETGTSFSTPMVAGAAALILAAHPTYTPRQVRDALRANATPGVVQDSQSPVGSSRLLYVPPPDQPGSATPSSDLNVMFNTYGNQGGHWTGGDEAMSVKLPDGRVAWFFGDTNLGTVNPDFSRPRNSPMVHNAIVVQEGNTLTQTLVGGTEGDPRSLVGSETDGQEGDLGWWPGEGRVVGNELQVFYTHVGHGGGGTLSFTTLDQAVARFALPSLTLTSLTSLGLSTDIDWGTAMVDGPDGMTYIYGRTYDGSMRHLRIARAPSNALVGSSSAAASSWTFWTGTGWSSSESAAVSVMTGVDSSFSVKRLQDGRYVLVTLDGSQPFTNRLVAYFAEAPVGPFMHMTHLYDAPIPNGRSYTYNARAHLEQPSSGTFVVSYNVNSFNSDDIYADVRLYRPKFVHVTLPPPVADASLLPDAPRNLTATAPSNGRVDLSWSMPGGAKNANVVYRVYQRSLSGGASDYTRPQGTLSTTSTTLSFFNPGVYEFRVTAQNSAGEGPASLAASAVVVIPKPTTAPVLAGTSNVDGSVALSWTPVTAAGWVNYRVYQQDLTAGQPDFAEAPNVFVDGTTAKVTGLTNGNRYAFRVAATNGGGEGPASNSVEVTSAVAPPPAPTNLVATPNDDGTIGLTWNSSGPGLWYWVYAKDVTAGETSFTQLDYPVSTGTTFTAGYLALGHTYDYQVRAIGAGGTLSPPSNIARATARIAPPPTPTNLGATPNDDGTISLAWTSSGPTIWYYVYSRDVTGGQTAFTRSQYPISNGPEFTAAYLMSGNVYEFYVTAIGTDGTESAPSNRVQATARVAPPPAPTQLTATSNSDGTIGLSWRSSGPDIWYWVYTRVADTGSYTRSQYPVSNGTTHTAGFLAGGQTYQFYVTAIGSDGTESAPSNVAQAVSYVPPPAAPTNLSGTPGNAVVNLSWTGTGAGVWYWVYSRDVTAGQSAFTRSQYPVSNGTTHTAAFLTNGHTYAFYVTAIGTGGTESAPSNTIQAIPRIPAPPAPTNLTATPLSNGNIALSWSSSGAGIWYWVYSRDMTVGQSAFTRSKYPVSNGTTFLASYLALNHRYAFYVTAFNDGGESPRSNIAEATSSIPPPPAPTNLAATPRNDGTIQLTWGSSGSGLWYSVYISDNGGAYKKVALPITDGTSFVAAYLTNGHTYRFYVKAIGKGGEGPPSNTAQATATIAPPTNLNAVWTDRATARLTWRASNPSGMFYVYVRNGTSGPWTRQTYPVSARTWQTVSPLTGTSYQFYVTQVGAYGGESAPSNIFTLASSYPLPPPGSVTASISNGGINCKQVSELPIKVCTTIVYYTGYMSGWSAAFQQNWRLNLQWQVRNEGSLKTTHGAYCQGDAGGITACQRTGSYEVSWTAWLNDPPWYSAPQICVTTLGYGNYYRDANGSTARVSGSARQCITPGAPAG